MLLADGPPYGAVMVKGMTKRDDFPNEAARRALGIARRALARAAAYLDNPGAGDQAVEHEVPKGKVAAATQLLEGVEDLIPAGWDDPIPASIAEAFEAVVEALSTVISHTMAQYNGVIFTADELDLKRLLKIIRTGVPTS